MGPFGPCNASCGGGERVRPVDCVRDLSGAEVEKVPDSECSPDMAPDTVEKCNLQPCPARCGGTVLDVGLQLSAVEL